MSKKPKLTPWFSLSVPPARVGSYEIKTSNWSGPCFSFFDGERWNGGYSTPADAARAPTQWTWLRPSNKPNAQWRGLAQNPSPGAAHQPTEGQQ